MWAKFKNTLNIALNLALGIKDTQLMHYASSLSFHTILAVIPVLLISFSIFTQLPAFSEYYAKIQEFVFSALLPTHQSIIAEYLQKFLQNSVSLGIIGFIAIIFTSAMFFIDYEYVVNEIMQSQTKRGFWVALSAYWTLITLAPIGLGLSFYMSNLLQNLLNSTQFTSWINFISIFPYLIIWAIFCVTYLISVSQGIKFKNALISSFVASLVWYLGKSAFVYYVVYNKTYLSIYGSFSVILFFFLWVYISWIIFLYGLKLCKFLESER
ncbi:YihY family inner membrane protein [Campylobacter sp. faydin G-105]|uniref:YihY family inner membrane protein n=1 Tax=Campylobacter anatolicus TaxID=2829105 RepID=UPI001B988C76|nr:YihY family inner membrane protein [Campylobacter anatolicus]MBR8462147.1 YihY family inner membrane protein [Campylobacter anatolicus]